MTDTTLHQGWRGDLRLVSNCLFEVTNDDNYELPDWFANGCQIFSLFVLDAIVDVSKGRFPDAYKYSVPFVKFVDKWHLDARGTPAPFGRARLKALFYRE